MIDNFTFLFKYLEKENISIDKTEFEFQSKSHPDYPALLSIADTLSFFNIKNGGIKVSFDEIDLLPDFFISVLYDDAGAKKNYFIERVNSEYFLLNDKKLIKIELLELKNRWTDLILLVEKTENVTVFNQKKSNWNFVFPLIILLLFLFLIFQSEVSLPVKLFLLFPLLGVLFSFAALKDLFGAKSELLNNFCKITETTSCNTIIDSKKWKIFEIVNFSDLSITFFATQFFSLLLFLITPYVDVFFSIQKILLFCSIPVIILSVYFQKVVEKKWCPICLVIISIILSELIYLLVILKYAFKILLDSLIYFTLVFASTILVWFSLKKTLAKQKELKEFQQYATRFIRNYEVFKNNLLRAETSDYKFLKSGNITIGNTESKLKITIITNPYCSFCVEAHKVINEIYNKHGDKIFIDFRFNLDFENSNETSIKLHQNFIRIYLENGQEAFMKALNNWFETKDERKIIETQNSQFSNLIDAILKEQFEMNHYNMISFTPVLLINKYRFPKDYDRNNLIYFILDLLDDEDI